MTGRRAPDGAAGQAGRGPVRSAGGWLSPWAWAQALGAAVAGMGTMAGLAALGMWAAGAGDLPGGAFHRVVAAVVVMAAGGTVTLSGDAGFLASADAALDVVPLSVTVAGFLVLAAVFLVPFRHRAVAGAGELGGHLARTALFWLLLLLIVANVAHHDFTVSVGNGIADELGSLLGATPTVGFRSDVPETLGVGLLWVLAVLVAAFLVARRAPHAPGLARLQASARPLASAMVCVLLAYVVLGLLTSVVVLFTQGHEAETLAVVCLALPNLVWMAFGIGTGGAWHGHADRSIGLPMPHVLDQILRTRHENRTLDLAAVSGHDGRAWLLVVVAAVLLLTAAFLAALRSPPRLPAWRHALRTAAALGLTLPAVGLLTRVSAHQGLSLIGVGDLGGFGGEVTVQPELLRLTGVGLGWGLVTGFLGSLLARWVRGRGGAKATVAPDGP